MMGVAMIFQPGSPKPEFHEFDDKIPSAAFRRKVLGGDGDIIPHFTTVTWDGALYNCIAFHKPGEGQRHSCHAAQAVLRLATAQDQARRSLRSGAHPLRR